MDCRWISKSDVLAAGRQSIRLEYNIALGGTDLSVTPANASVQFVGFPEFRRSPE